MSPLRFGLPTYPRGAALAPPLAAALHADVLLAATLAAATLAAAVAGAVAWGVLAAARRVASELCLVRGSSGRCCRVLNGAEVDACRASLPPPDPAAGLVIGQGPSTVASTA